MLRKKHRHYEEYHITSKTVGTMRARYFTLEDAVRAWEKLPTEKQEQLCITLEETHRHFDDNGNYVGAEIYSTPVSGYGA